MFKKSWLFLVVCLLTAVLTACGGSESNSEEKKDGNPAASEEQKNEDSGENKKEEEKEEKKDDKKETQKSEVGELTVVKKKKDLGLSFENGPMVLDISAAQVAHLKVAESYKDMFDGKDEVTVVTVEMKAENTSEDTVSFYPDQATLATDAGEQKDADLVLSDQVGGDFHGKIKKDGNVIFILESDPEAINNLKLVISGAHDENLDRVGEDMKIDISL